MEEIIKILVELNQLKTGIKEAQPRITKICSLKKLMKYTIFHKTDEEKKKKQFQNRT